VIESNFSDLTIKIIPDADHGYSSPEHIEKGQMVPGVREFIAYWISALK